MSTISKYEKLVCVFYRVFDGFLWWKLSFALWHMCLQLVWRGEWHLQKYDIPTDRKYITRLHILHRSDPTAHYYSK